MKIINVILVKMGLINVFKISVVNSSKVLYVKSQVNNTNIGNKENSVPRRYENLSSYARKPFAESNHVRYQTDHQISQKHYGWNGIQNKENMNGEGKKLLMKTPKPTTYHNERNRMDERSTNENRNGKRRSENGSIMM